MCFYFSIFIVQSGSIQALKNPDLLLLYYFMVVKRYILIYITSAVHQLQLGIKLVGKHAKEEPKFGYISWTWVCTDCEYYTTVSSVQ